MPKLGSLARFVNFDDAGAIPNHYGLARCSTVGWLLRCQVDLDRRGELSADHMKAGQYVPGCSVLLFQWAVNNHSFVRWVVWEPFSAARGWQDC